MSAVDVDTLASAALEGDESAVRQALAQGASPDTCDEHGWAALHNALLSGPSALAVASILVQAGASTQATTCDGLTPLHLVHEADPKVDWKVTRGSTADGRSSFFCASLVQLLIDGGARVNAASSDGSTPLHLAAATGATSTVMALLHCGADVHAPDDSQRTALVLAGTRATRPMTNEHMVRLRGLLKAAADGACNVEGYSLCGVPACGEAAFAGLRLAESDSDDDSDEWSAALAAVPTELPNRLYGPPPSRPPPNVERRPPLSPHSERRPPLSPHCERRPPLSPPSRKRSGSAANIALSSPPGAGAATPGTPKSARHGHRADIQNFTLG